MAPTPEQLLLIARARRKRAEAEPPEGARPANAPFDAERDNAQAITGMLKPGYSANYMQPSAPIDPLAPKKGEEWRKVDRSAPLPGPPVFLSPENSAKRMQATAELRKAEQENADFRAKRGPLLTGISDTITGGMERGSKFIVDASTAGMDAIDPERKASRFISDSVGPLFGNRPGDDLVRAIPGTAASMAENPAVGVGELAEMAPPNMIARGGNNLRDAGNAFFRGDLEEAQRKYSQGMPDLLMGTLGATPFGSVAVEVGRNALARPGNALRAQIGRAAEGFDAPKPGANLPPINQTGAPVQPSAAGGPPIQPPAPIAQAANAAPPPGNLQPVTTPPVGQVSRDYAGLHPKVRAAVNRLLENSGVEPQRIPAIIANLDQLPPDKSEMVVTELIRKFGAGDPKLETNIEKVGRDFTVNTPTGKGDNAQAVVRGNIRRMLDEQGPLLEKAASDRFGPGAVATNEAIEAEVNQIRSVYRRILDPNKPYGNITSPAKRKEIDAAREDLKSYLKGPDVAASIPNWVRQDAINTLNRDLRAGGYQPIQKSGMTDFEWAEIVDAYPTQIAHSLQSSFATAGREASKSTDMQGKALARDLSEKRVGLLYLLEKSVDKYRDTRVKFGHEMGARDALTLPERFLSIADDEVKLGQLLDDLDELTPAQFDAAKSQITTVVRNAMGKKIENASLAEVGAGDRGVSTPNLTQLSKRGVLEALEKAFGADGKKLADDIRLSRAKTNMLTKIEPDFGARSASNIQDAANAPRLYEDPTATGANVIDQAGATLGGLGLGLGAMGNIPAAAGVLSLAGARAIWQAIKNGRKLSPEQRTQFAQFLFALRRGEAEAPRLEGPDAPPPSGPPPITGPKGPPKISAPAASAASRPPEKMGFGGSKQPLPMDGGAARDAKGIEFKDGLGGARIGPAEATFIVDGDNIRIPMLRIGNTAERGKGAASRLLDAIIHKADAEGKRIFLTPEPVATGAGLTQRQLEKFYRSRGFVPNKGRSQDFEFRESFVRNPSKRSSSLPMDEASRMGRAREQGFDTGRVAYRGLGRAYDESGKGGGRRYQMFTSSESDAAEYGSNVVSAYLRKGNNLQLDGGGRNFNSVSVSQLPDDVRAKLHPSIQGVARIDDIADAAQKAGYDSVTVANVFDNAWGEVPTKQRPRTQKDIDLDNDLLRELGIDPADTPSAPRAPSPPKKNTDPVTIDVVFDTKNIRSADATFDPAQSGSSKLLAGVSGLGGVGMISAAATMPKDEKKKPPR